MTFLFTMTADVIVMLPVFLRMFGAAAPITLPPHPGNVGAPIALLLLTLTAGIHLHSIGVSSGCLHRMVSASLLLGFALSHALIENLGCGLQIIKICDGAVGNGQIVLELLIE